MKPMRFTWEGMRISCHQYYEVAPNHSLYQDGDLIDSNQVIRYRAMWKAFETHLEKTLLG